MKMTISIHRFVFVACKSMALLFCPALLVACGGGQAGHSRMGCSAAEAPLSAASTPAIQQTSSLPARGSGSLVDSVSGTMKTLTTEIGMDIQVLQEDIGMLLVDEGGASLYSDGYALHDGYVYYMDFATLETPDILRRYNLETGDIETLYTLNGPYLSTSNPKFVVVNESEFYLTQMAPGVNPDEDPDKPNHYRRYLYYINLATGEETNLSEKFGILQYNILEFSYWNGTIFPAYTGKTIVALSADRESETLFEGGNDGRVFCHYKGNFFYQGQTKEGTQVIYLLNEKLVKPVPIIRFLQTTPDVIRVNARGLHLYTYPAEKALIFDMAAMQVREEVVFPERAHDGRITDYFLELCDESYMLHAFSGAYEEAPVAQLYDTHMIRWYSAEGELITEIEAQ